ncbi:MAG: neuraminidase (sialidase)-like protein, partial [Bacteroidetes bacterium]
DIGYPLARRLGWQTRNKPVALPGGRLILPLYSDRFSFSLMALTDDGGQTWSFSTPLVGAGNVQPAIARRTDGTLVAYMRDNGPPPQRLHVSTSTDDGATWSDVRDSDHVNSGTAADVVVLANGHWAMVNNDTETGRYRLTVSISPDEGRTWPWSRALSDDDRGNEATRSHYPAIIQSRDGLLHVIYSVHHEDRSGPRKTIHHARFNEAWVRGEG